MKDSDIQTRAERALYNTFLAIAVDIPGGEIARDDLIDMVFDYVDMYGRDKEAVTYMLALDFEEQTKLGLETFKCTSYECGC